MPVFAGTKESFGQGIGLDPYTSENLFTARDYYTGDVLPANNMAGDIDGPIIHVYATPHNTVFAGSKSTDFFNDWYNRIHVIPSATDLGNLVSTQSQDVSLWNAYLTQKPFTGITITGTAGITVTPPTGVTPPTTLAASQFITYTITLDIAGPPVVDTVITYTIDGVEYTSTIVGRRVVLMPFLPNWKQGVEETLLYRSSLSRSFNGTEQTMSLRSKPRRQLSYTVLLQRADAQRMDNLIYGWQSRLYGVPIWPEKSVLTADVAAGDLVLAAETTNRSFTAGGLLALYRDASTVDVREIESIVGTAVTLKAPVSRNWPAGTRVHPVMVAAINASLSGRRLTDGVIEVPLSFEAEPSSNLYPFTDGANPSTYRSEELFTGRVNWESGIEFQWESDATRFDTGSGKFQLLPRSIYSDMTRGHTWTLEGYGQVADFREWAQRRKGRAKPVWVPSGFTDFSLVSPVLIGANRLDVASNDYNLYALDTNKRRDVFVKLKNGTTFARRVTAATIEEGGVIALQLDNGVPEAFGLSDVARISFLQFCRLASDNITLRWLTDSVATVDASLVTKRE